jgi:hypothetical protein
MSETFVCGCKGTVHDPACGYWKRSSGLTPFVSNTSIADDDFERDVLRKLDRIIVLLEEIAGRRP